MIPEDMVMNENYYLSYEVMRARQRELLEWVEMERKAIAARLGARQAAKRGAQLAFTGTEQCCECCDARRSA
jgi:hypothetical protein